MPSTWSFGEKPDSSAAASVMTFHVEPACRPGYSVAMLYWLDWKPGPPTIASTSPFFGFMATSEPVKPDGELRSLSTTFWAWFCIVGFSVA